MKVFEHFLRDSTSSQRKKEARKEVRNPNEVYYLSS